MVWTSQYLDSPVRFQVVKTSVRKLGETTKKYLKQKHQQFLNAVIKRLAGTIAPTQSDIFIFFLHGVVDKKEKVV